MAETTYNPIKAITLKVLSVLTFIIMMACIKSTATDIPPGEAVFFRSFFGMPVLLLWLYWRGHLPQHLKTSDITSHFWRGLFGVIAMGLSFVGIGLLPLPEAVAIGYLAPLLVTIFAAMFLGERIRIYRLSAVLLGLVGVILVLSPRLSVGISDGAAASMETIGVMAALMSALCAALAQVFVRKLVNTEHTGAIVFYFTLTATIMSLVTLIFGWAWPTPEQAALLILAGTLGGFGQIALTESYRYAEIAVIAPFEYSSMLFALIFGYFIFDEVPTHTVLGGGFLIICAGLIILLREHQLGLAREKAKIKSKAAAPTQV